MLVERGPHLDISDELLDHCARGRGGVFLVTGPVGSGKTALLRTVADRAATAGIMVLDAVGSHWEREQPFAALHQLFGGLSGPPGGRSVSAMLDDESLWTADASGTHRLRSRAGREIAHALEWHAGRAPLVLLVDDVHHVDLASLQFLVSFAERTNTSRVVLVASQLECPLSARQPRTVLVAELMRHPHFRRMRADPLSLEGIRAALVEGSGRAVPTEVARSWQRVTGGNPFLVRALLEDLATAGGDVVPAEPEFGGEFAKAMLACLNRGGPRFLHAARGAAVLALSDSLDLLAPVVGEDEDATARIVEAMNAAALLDDRRCYRHPVLREAVLAETPSALRAKLNHRAALLLAARGEEPHRVGLHLVEAESTDAPDAVAAIVAAAHEALRAGALDLAARSVRLAEEAGDEDQRTRVAVVRARVEFRVDPPGALRHLAPLLEAVGDGRAPARDLVPVLRHLVGYGCHAEAALIIDGLGAGIGPLDQETAAELCVVRAWWRALRRREMPWSSRLDARLPEEAQRTAAADPLVRVVALLDRVLRDGADEVAAATADRLLQSITALNSRTFWAVRDSVRVLVYADHHRAARRWCAHWIGRAADGGATAWQAILLATAADIALRCGDPRSARAHAEHALELLPVRVRGAESVFLRSCLSLAARALAEPDTGVYPPWPASVPSAETAAGLCELYARGVRHLAEDRPELALEDLLTCGRAVREQDADLPVFLPWRLPAVEALVALGLRARATELAREQMGRPSTQQPRMRGMSLRALASTLTDPSERREVLTSAVEVLERTPDRLELARACVDLSAAQQALGDSASARTTAERADRLAAEVRAAPPPPVRVPRVEATAPHPVDALLLETFDGEEPLSTAELRVVRLAVDGYTNRAIAENLFITVSTVEQHLTRCYRKLELAGRADLAAYFDQRPDATWTGPDRAGAEPPVPSVRS